MDEREQSRAQTLRALYTAYERRLYYIALKLLGSREDAEDALHDTFLKISQNLEKIDDVDSNKTYAYIVTILKNTCLDALRRRARRRTEDLDAAECEADGGASPQQLAEDKLEAEALARLIEQLPESYRAPLVLRYAMGLSEKETAERLGLHARQVALRVFRAKQRLRRMAGEAQKKGGGQT